MFPQLRKHETAQKIATDCLGLALNMNSGLRLWSLSSPLAKEVRLRIDHDPFFTCAPAMARVTIECDIASSGGTSSRARSDLSVPM
jgi:hypothetical protein